jgi:hypothetical protein
LRSYTIIQQIISIADIFFAALLFLTRPEGLFVGILLIGFVYFKYRSLRKILPGIIIIVSFVLVVTIFRILTYGAVLPNSVIAKSFPLNLLPGLALPIFRYVVGFVRSNAYFVILALGGGFALIRARSIKDKQTEILLFCLTCLLFSMVVMVRNGGDWMGNHRLLVQYGILYSVLLIVLVSNHSLSILFASALVILPFLQTTNLFITFKPELFPRYIENTNLYVEASTRLAPVLNPSDSISAEAVGYISFHLIETPFIDPLGLTNTYIANNGDPAIPYGKTDIRYLAGTLKPSVMIWHYPGHMRGVDPVILSNYTDYCLGSCIDWNGFLVMIRRDREKDLAPVFSDWQKIDISTDWPK